MRAPGVINAVARVSGVRDNPTRQSRSEDALLLSKEAAAVAAGWRRLAAYFVDYLVIALYIALLAAVSTVVRTALGLGLEPPSTTRDRLLGHALGFAVLTLPVLLYFALTEWSGAQATVGKRVLRLRVTDAHGKRIGFGQSLLRSAVKLAPWEIAHAALWHTRGWPIDPQPTALNWTGWILSLLLVGSYVVALFVGTRRPPYDRIAGTRVAHA